jgi:hypothetical protein
MEKNTRTLLVLVMLAVSATYAQAQDAGQMAAQQAQQAAQQANQDAQQAMQMNQQAAQTAAQQAQMAQTDGPMPPCCVTDKPRFSVKGGSYASPVTVKLTDKTRGAIIYYTTDGWTPTNASNRYLGPITISSTTTLQAVAIAPYSAVYGRSLVVSAQYTINGPGEVTASAPLNALPAIEAVPQESSDGKVTLAQGTAVLLVFGADVNSKTASVGDRIPLTLSDDLKVGNVAVARKGSTAVALIIQVDKTGIGGAPGDITFQVDSLTVNGSVIPLSGFATKEGEAKPPGPARLIPYAGFFTVFKHGTDADIKQGTPFTAFVNADTALSPTK